MTIKWYNRDSISDVEMRQARIVAEKLKGKKKDILDAISVEQLEKTYGELNFGSQLPTHFVMNHTPQWDKNANIDSNGKINSISVTNQGYCFTSTKQDAR